MVKQPITKLGYERLHWQLEYLRRCSRREVARDLAEARECGITNRNLQWRTAREKQHWVESRIEDLERKIEQSEVVISPIQTAGYVAFGVFVEVHLIGPSPLAGFDRGRVFQLVGPFESDVSAGRLSVDSPLGRELLGRCLGEVVTIEAPRGLRRYAIKAVFSAVETGYPRITEAIG